MTSTPHSLTDRASLPRLQSAGLSELAVWLDRLADGELSDDQRRAVLLQLEELPGGWRNCALAFVQAQVLSQDLCSALGGEASANGEAPRVVVVAADCRTQDGGQSLQSASAVLRNGAKRTTFAQSVQPSVVSSAAGEEASGLGGRLSTPAAQPARSHSVGLRRGLNWRRWAGHAGIVACFVVAFGLGVVLRHAWDGGGGDAGSMARGGLPGPELHPLVNNAGRPAGIEVPSVVPGGVARVVPHKRDFSQGVYPQSETPVGKLTMVVNQGEGQPPAEMQVPVLSVPALASWLKSQRPVVSQQVAEAMRNQGHHVDVWAEYLPIVLDDGRTVLVPLEMVEVELRDPKNYQ